MGITQGTNDIIPVIETALSKDRKMEKKRRILVFFYSN
jgi:hypothetical protein